MPFPKKEASRTMYVPRTTMIMHEAWMNLNGGWNCKWIWEQTISMQVEFIVIYLLLTFCWWGGGINQASCTNTAKLSEYKKDSLQQASSVISLTACWCVKMDRVEEAINLHTSVYIMKLDGRRWTPFGCELGDTGSFGCGWHQCLLANTLLTRLRHLSNAKTDNRKAYLV